MLGRIRVRRSDPDRVAPPAARCAAGGGGARQAVERAERMTAEQLGQATLPDAALVAAEAVEKLASRLL